jgi:hypothetical protein
MTKREQAYHSMQRGLLAVEVEGDAVRFVVTSEGRMVADCIARGVPIPCLRCGKPYPKAGQVPKYSMCSPCRTNLDHPRFYLQRRRK